MATSQELMQEAARRYIYDAEFHAKVEMTLQLLAIEGQPMTDDDDRALALHAAAVALMVQEEALWRSAPPPPKAQRVSMGPRGQITEEVD